MERKFKSLSEALYADSDYLTKLANKPNMSSYCQEIINATVDINRAAFTITKLKEAIGKIKNELENSYIGECLYDGGIERGINLINKHTEGLA